MRLASRETEPNGLQVSRLLTHTTATHRLHLTQHTDTRAPPQAPASNIPASNIPASNVPASNVPASIVSATPSPTGPDGLVRPQRPVWYMLRWLHIHASGRSPHTPPHHCLLHPPTAPPNHRFSRANSCWPITCYPTFPSPPEPPPRALPTDPTLPSSPPAP